MKVCSYCGQENREGTLFCEECGQTLFGEQGAGATSTKQFERENDKPEIQSTWGTAQFNTESSIVVQIQDALEPVVLQPSDETVFGRRDAASGVFPDLDLTPFGALKFGVSRLHAAIRRGEGSLMLVDLGSVNGTHLNGQRLIPNQPRVVRDGDEIRLGKLILHIYFK
jgi:pSer/pThr/pTyr-binding forkhead associated (FHA) protein